MDDSDGPVAWWRLTLLVVLLLIGISASGCVQVTVTSQEPVADTAGSPSLIPVERDGSEKTGVVILGIDFDPPLQPQSVMAVGHLALLVVIENLGNLSAEGVVIDARLTGPTDQDLLLQQRLPTAPLAPGETRIVSFDNIPMLPVRSTYLLSVTAISNAEGGGEGSVRRDSKFYRFDVSQSVR